MLQLAGNLQARGTGGGGVRLLEMKGRVWNSLVDMGRQE
jgi:hypothetical protein